MNTESKNPLIAIMGTPVSSGNRGVLALGNSLVQLCLQAENDARIVLLVGNRDAAPVRMMVDGKLLRVPVVNYRLSPRSALREHLLWILVMAVLYRLVPLNFLRKWITNGTPWISCVSESMLVGDVRGGDSFSDIYGMQRFLLGFLPVWSVLLIRKNIVLFPQTYGPFKSKTAKLLARYILRRASIIIARDRESLLVAADLAGSSKQVVLSPDVAFAMAAAIPDRLVVAPPLSGALPPDTIGLNVNGLMYNGGYTRRNMFGLNLDYPAFLMEVVRALLAEHPGELLLVPHTFAPADSVESDNEACRKLRSSLPEAIRNRVRVVDAEYDEREIKGVIGMCDFFIGSRMHSCIAALSQGVPCVGVAYSRKFRGVFDSVGVAEWVVDARKVDSNEAVRIIMDIYRKRNQVRADMQRRAAEAKAGLAEVFEKLVDQARLSRQE